MIPKDQSGRTYDIHHIDGDRTNNHITNLQAVSIEEHYDIHYQQGDWAACHRIAARMNLPSEVLSELARRLALKRIEDGTHHFLGAKNPVHQRVADGTHHLQGGAIQKRNNTKRIFEGTHHFLGGEISRRVQQQLIESGKHHFLSGDISRSTYARLSAEGTHVTQVKVTCPHCGKIGTKPPMARHHFDRCKLKVT